MKRPKKRPPSQMYLFEETHPILNSDKQELAIEEYKALDSIDVGLITNNIYCDDTVEGMKKITSNSINLILTSPPYLASIRKDNHKYPGAKDQVKDNQSVDDYLEWMIENFKEYERILKDDGVIAFNFSYTTFNPSLPYDLINKVFENTGLRIYDTIAWKKKSAMPVKRLK